MRKTIYKARTRTGSYHDFSGMTTNQNPDISLNSSVINNGEIENKTNSKGSNFKRTTSLKTGVSDTEKLTFIFKKLDYDKNESISSSDLQKFKTEFGDEVNISAFEKKIYEQEKNIDLAEFLFSCKENLKLCKNFIHLFQTKINKLQESIEKYIGYIDFKYLNLTVIVPEVEKSIQNGNSYKNQDDNIKQSFPLNSYQDIIKINKIGYEFQLKDDFLILFLSDEFEHTKEISSNLKIKMKLDLSDTATKKDEEKIQKIKQHLNANQAKINTSSTELNNYKEIFEGITSTSNDLKDFKILLNYLNKLLLLEVNSHETENDNSFISNENSFISGKGVSTTIFKNPFRKKFMNNNENLNMTKTSLNISQQEMDLDRSVNSPNRPPRTTANSRKNFGFLFTHQIEKVIEEPKNMVDEKLKKLIKSQKTKTEPIKNKRGSLASLLKFAIQTNTILRRAEDFSVCSEYMKSIKN